MEDWFGPIAPSNPAPDWGECRSCGIAVLSLLLGAEWRSVLNTPGSSLTTLRVNRQTGPGPVTTYSKYGSEMDSALHDIFMMSVMREALVADQAAVNWQIPPGTDWLARLVRQRTCYSPVCIDRTTTTSIFCPAFIRGCFLSGRVCLRLQEPWLYRALPSRSSS